MNLRQRRFKSIALLAAGFSRNWGGWLATEVFEYLLGSPQITPLIRDTLFRHRKGGGYEAALGEFQSEFFRFRDPLTERNLRALEEAILLMFAAMDRGFQTIEFEKEGSQERKVSKFLSRFDAIFSLNQDLLLERYYFRSSRFADPSGWRGFNIVGVRRDLPGGDAGIGGAGLPGGNNSNIGTWVPGGLQEVPPDLQPYYKLHGSSNWRGTNNIPIMVGGTGKQGLIDSFPVLGSLHRAFKHQLTTGHVRLMVIGYGFGDQHINQMIKDAADGGGLEIFIVDPQGFDVLDKNRSEAGSADDLLVKLGPHVRGASRRGLREIFSSDHVEHTKMSVFLD